MDSRPILVGTDFSKAADIAIADACDLARHMDVGLVLARVCYMPEVPGLLDMATERVLRELEQVKRKELEAEERYLDRLVRRTGEKGIAVEKILIEGNPARGLLRVAKDVDASMIVVGDRGRTAAEESRLGGVAARVAHAAERKVLITRHGARTEGGYRRILVATDFTGVSERLMEVARQVAARDAHIDLLFCWGLPWETYSRAMFHESPETLATETIREILDHARRRGQELAQHHSTGTQIVDFHVREVRARKGIVRHLDGEHFDLVILGSHSRRGIQRLALGSTASAVLRRAPTSVLIVPIDPIAGSSGIRGRAK